VNLTKKDLAFSFRLGSIFLVSFFLLGYDLRLCLILGIFGGLSGSIVVSGWNDKTQASDNPKKLDLNLDPWSESSLYQRQLHYRKTQAKKHRGKPPDIFERLSKWLGTEEDSE